MNSTVNATDGTQLSILVDMVLRHVRDLQPLVPTYLHLIISAILPIYTAAHASLRRPPSAAPPAKKSSVRSTSIDDHDDSEAETELKIETLTLSDAVLFPVLAGATLTTLYLIIKWLNDPAILNRILGYYFTWIGLFFSFKFFRDALTLSRSFLFPAQYSRRGCVYELDGSDRRFKTARQEAVQYEYLCFVPGYLGVVRLPSRVVNALWYVREKSYSKLVVQFSTRTPFPKAKGIFSVTAVDVTSLFLAAVLAVYQSYTGSGNVPWYITNLVGFSFCYSSLQLMSPGTAAVGTLLLSLLFGYDIYMVFYTPMMVTVATKLDVPIKMIFPRPEHKGRNMAMLGLGDIVVPGILMAYALRFDLYRHYKLTKVDALIAHDDDDPERKDKDTRPVYRPARGAWAERLYTKKALWSDTLRAKAFPKPYFHATMTGYILGMLATVLIMQVFQHAQPALLYLVPGVLAGLWGTALWKREIKMLWTYDEQEEDKDPRAKPQGQKKNKNEEKQNSETGAEPEKATKDTPIEQTEENVPAESNGSGTSDVSSGGQQREQDTSSPLQPCISINIYIPGTTGSTRNKSSSRDDIGKVASTT